MAIVNHTPYRNLILTAPLGVGKTGVGRRVAQEMHDAAFVDLDIELQQREGQSQEQIRATFGVARLQSLEHELIDEVSLQRSTVIAVNGETILTPPNLERLQETGPVLCLTAALGEILRRLHVAQGGRFHQADVRAVALGRLKREREVLALDLPTLDTTGLTIDEVAQRAAAFWLNESDL